MDADQYSTILILTSKSIPVSELYFYTNVSKDHEGQYYSGVHSYKFAEPHL
jgi:hypothetical protein